MLPGLCVSDGDETPFAAPFNFTGQPSISPPLCRSSTGLPVGMMFSARYADEATLFRLAAQLEKECPWQGGRIPPVGTVFRHWRHRPILAASSRVAGGICVHETIDGHNRVRAPS